MKPLIIYLLFFLLFIQNSFAQLTDNFADGDFSNNPSWIGQTDVFTVNNEELQLFNPDATGSNESYLTVSAPTSSNQNTTWEFYVRLEFAPSGSNFAQIYLMASMSDLTGDVEGYHVRVGGISGTMDALQLIRQDGNTSSVLLEGTPGAVGASPAQARVRVTRSTTGDWELFADYTGGTNFSSEGTAMDDTYNEGAFFGVFCRYSSTRNDAFFFDDILVDPLFQDTTPPELINAEANSSTQVTVTFSEPIDSESGGNTSNYIIDNGIGNPSNAEVSFSDPQLVTLTLANPLVSNQTYNLTIDNILDLTDNESGSQSTSFTFIEIGTILTGDLIISEIMADPTPPVGLPETEFVELYNTSDKTFQLDGVGFSSGSSPKLLPPFILLPNSYVILTDQEDVTLFEGLGDVIGVDGFPALTNGGDDLSLFDDQGTQIFEVNYSRSWYQDPNRDDGGYTLELIQLEGPYNCNSNWTASPANSGGTPGQINAANGQISDNQGPILSEVSIESDFEILLTFDEALEGAVTDPTSYFINNGISVTSVNIQSATEVLLTLSPSLEGQTIYQVGVTSALTDCVGNTADESVLIDIALTEIIEFEDIIISEIMAAPNSFTTVPNAEYVELYNQSNKLLQLSDLQFSNGDSPKQLPNRLVQPREYLILLDEDFEDLFTPFGTVVTIGSFPTLTNAGSTLTLLATNNATIFQVTYDNTWYQDEEKDGGGYSLELIDLNGPYDCSNNWRATESLNPEGGTPGQQNSLFGQEPDMTPPSLLQVIPQNEFELTLLFDGQLNEQAAEDIQNYFIDNDIRISSAALQLPQKSEVQLVLEIPLQTGTLYNITIGSSLINCLGTAIGVNNSLDFGLPEPAVPNDLIINEVLFFAESGGKDFVEILNRSNKIINLNGLEIANTLKEVGDTIGMVDQDFLVFPGEFIVITEDPEDIAFRYTVPNPQNLVLADLPTLDSDEGNVTIRLDGIILDAFDYRDDQHYGLLSDRRGVSLERIDPTGPTQSDGNWHSAASSVGFATPTIQNSQFFENPSIINEVISLPKTTFSPDGNGFEDVLLINYAVEQPGFNLNIRVYDAQGRLVTDLVNNELLAATGTIKWDGTTEQGIRARIGIYILWIELFDLDGNVDRMKKAVVVAGELK